METETNGATGSTKPNVVTGIPEPKSVICPSCRAREFEVLDEATGLLRCEYCRAQWIDERFVKLTATERFVKQQAEQPPRPVIDNTSDTDRQLMQIIGGVVSGGLTGSLNGCLYRVTRTVKVVLIVVILVIIASFIATHIDWAALGAGQGLVWR